MQCDLWTLARSELFLDEKPCYLEVACGKREWPRHAHAVRRRDRRYIVWLKNQLRLTGVGQFPGDDFHFPTFANLDVFKKREPVLHPPEDPRRCGAVGEPWTLPNANAPAADAHDEH